MAGYAGANGAPKKIVSAYVGHNNTVKKISSIYVGDANNKPKLCWLPTLTKPGVHMIEDYLIFTNRNPNQVTCKAYIEGYNSALLSITVNGNSTAVYDMSRVYSDSRIAFADTKISTISSADGFYDSSPADTTLPNPALIPSGYTQLDVIFASNSLEGFPSRTVTMPSTTFRALDNPDDIYDGLKVLPSGLIQYRSGESWYTAYNGERWVRNGYDNRITFFNVNKCGPWLRDFLASNSSLWQPK